MTQEAKWNEALITDLVGTVRHEPGSETRSLEPSPLQKGLVQLGWVEAP